MSEEKKNEVTEEVKETRELTEKELAQVSGGVGSVAADKRGIEPAIMKVNDN